MRDSGKMTKCKDMVNYIMEMDHWLTRVYGSRGVSVEMVRYLMTNLNIFQSHSTTIISPK